MGNREIDALFQEFKHELKNSRGFLAVILILFFAMLAVVSAQRSVRVQPPRFPLHRYRLPDDDQYFAALAGADVGRYSREQITRRGWGGLGHYQETEVSGVSLGKSKGGGTGDLSLCDKARTGRPPALDDEALQAAIEENSSQIRGELARQFNTSSETVRLHLHRLGKTYRHTFGFIVIGLAKPMPSFKNESEKKMVVPLGILLLLSQKKIKIKKKTQNAFIKTPNPPYPTHDAQPIDGKGLILPTTIIDAIATHSRFLILSLPNNEMSPFTIQKALKGIGGDPKSVKKLRSGDLLIETISALQTKSFLLVKIFIDSNLTVTPHKSLNSCRGVISEPDLLYASEAEILEGLSDQVVTQVRRITILRDSTRLPTKHIILTFNSPKLPTTIKAGYLNCKIRPYIPNPLRCFKCKRFGHSQTACRGQVT
ncbi:uncharacterized protein TNCV_1872191 [Trichonephila clavipes]|nr:uncharacterized protein TNCV_1872191 [Trichonephila clavipes]